MKFELKVNTDLSLKLRGLSDAKKFFEITNKNRVHLRKWFPWVDATKTVDDTEKYIQHCLNTFKNKKSFDLGIWYKGSWVGSIGFHNIDMKNKNGQIGYWLDKEHEGKGIVTKSTEALINYGFSKLKLNRIEIGCATKNIKSCAIPKRLNLKFEGIRRDGEWLYDHFVDIKIYSVLKKEWKLK